jgi:hypothetical protein
MGPVIVYCTLPYLDDNRSDPLLISVGLLRCRFGRRSASFDCQGVLGPWTLDAGGPSSFLAGFWFALLVLAVWHADLGRWLGLLVCSWIRRYPFIRLHARIIVANQLLYRKRLWRLREECGSLGCT